MSLEESLGSNGEFAALYGEVVTYDTYKLRDVSDVVSCNDPTYVHLAGHKGIDFIPDTVIDLGGNVGIFSRYCKGLYPNATIIAVEPNPVNCEVFRKNTQGVTLIEKGIGHYNKKLYHINGAANGAMEVYLSEGIGYNKKGINSMLQDGHVSEVEIENIQLSNLKEYFQGKVLCKIDVEGAETEIFDDPESVEFLKTFEYICGELHFYAMDGSMIQPVVDITNKFFQHISYTHNVEIVGIYFYCKKK